MPSTPPPEPTAGRGGSGGVPDGLLLTLLGLLLSSTVLVWSATGLSSLLNHGSWPSGVGIGKSTLAVRSLLSEPGDLATAWPDAAAESLARPGLFWGVFIGQLMLLATAAIFIATARARRRARKAERRERAAQARELARENNQRESATGLTKETESAGPAPAAPPANGQENAEHHASPSALASMSPSALAEAKAARAALDDVPQGDSAPAAVPPPLSAPLAHAALTPDLRPRGSALLLRGEADPADALATAEGAAVVITSDPALWSETVGARAKLGPTYLYDPTHAADAPVRIRWSPERGCGQMALAASRATALLAPVRSPAQADEMTHQTAETILRCGLHAAAISGQPFRQVHRWTTGGSASDAVAILRKDKSAASGAAGELEAALIGYPERRDQATALIRHALGALSQLHVRNSCTASKADALAVESFVSEGGTLYVLGESIEDPRRSPGAMPLVTALTTHVVELGRRMAGRSSSGRLDPPMTMLLDGPATVAPLPTLPSLLTEAETYGVHVRAYLRSHDQAAAWWPGLRADARSELRPDNARASSGSS